MQRGRQGANVPDEPNLAQRDTERSTPNLGETKKKDKHDGETFTQKHALVCPTRERQFESRDAAKLFIISNQLSRRNLPVAAIGDLKLEEKEIVAKQAEARMLAGKADPTPNLGEGLKAGKHDGETFTQLAKDIPLGRESLRKLEPLYAAEAERRMLAGKANPVQNSSQGEEKGRTRDKVAKAAGVSHDTIRRG